MNPGKIMYQVCRSARPKNISNLPWLWWAPRQFRASSIVSRKDTKFLEAGENSKETLLSGEVSDGWRAPQSPSNIPKGFLAVYVGPEQRRFVIPMAYLSIPEFRVLMDRAAEEFGFEQEGGLKLPCEEQEFEKLLIKCLTMQRRMTKSNRKSFKKI